MSFIIALHTMNGKLEEYIQKIRDFIQIDDKIVTYKWISKALKVHGNTAKQLLYAFVKKPEVKDLLTTYVVAGEPNGGRGLTYQLVREDELEEAKKKFSKVTSVHVYSVQKGRTVSGADIYNADGTFKLSPEDLKYCSIQPAEDIKLRDIRIPSPSADPGPSACKKPLFAQSSQNADKAKEPAPAKDKEEAARRTSPRKASPKKNESKKPAEAAKGGGIGALFMKQAAKKKEETAVKATKEKGRKEKEAIEEKAKEKEEEIKKNVFNGEKPEKVKVKTPSDKSKSQSKKKRKKPSDSKDSAAKRRKRIQVASDSESSDESESSAESDGDQRYPSPEPEPEAPTVIESEEEEIIPATPAQKGRKRVRKMVDRVYEDEGGFITTKKEYVFESCSDDESKPAKKKPDSASSPVSKCEEVSVKHPHRESSSEAKKEEKKKKDSKTPEEGKKKDARKPEEGKKTEAAGKKPGRPASKAKASGGNSPKKQKSILSFFKKT